MAMQLVIATKNEKKLRELRRYLKFVKADVVSLKEFQNIPRIVENGHTFKENAAKKALVVSRFANGLALADDSGLAVAALGGRPGVKSSRFAGPGKSDKANTRKVLKLLGGLGLNNRKARFICAVAIADKGRIVKLIEQSCSGLIAFEPKGRHGFGYDPVFLIPEYGRTFGQMGLKAKDRMSHRSKALKKAREFLRKYLVNS